MTPTERLLLETEIKHLRADMERRESSIRDLLPPESSDYSLVQAVALTIRDLAQRAEKAEAHIVSMERDVVLYEKTRKELEDELRNVRKSRDEANGRANRLYNEVQMAKAHANRRIHELETALRDKDQILAEEHALLLSHEDRFEKSKKEWRAIYRQMESELEVEKSRANMFKTQRDALVAVAAKEKTDEY